MISPELIKHLEFWGKVIGPISTTSGILYGLFRWVRTTSDTNKNVSLLMTNHFPHMQDCLDAHGTALQGIKSDFRELNTKVDSVGTRLDDTKKGVQVLGESFLRHLENSSKESGKKKKGK